MRPVQTLNKVQVELMKRIIEECIKRYGSNYTLNQYLEIKYLILGF